MSPRGQRWVAGAVSVLVLVGVVCTLPRDIMRAADARQLIAEGDLRWYRGNMHTHSLWSDGDDYLESIAVWYRDHGYQFLVFTDHNVLADKDKWVPIEKTKGGKVAFEKLEKQFPKDWVETRTNDDGVREVRLKKFTEVQARLSESGRYLLVQGEEVSDAFGKFPIHLNATNVAEVLGPRKGESVADTIQNNVDALIAQRIRTKRPMLIHLNHPNFREGVTAEDLMRVRGENFFEVYNGHPGVQNSGTEQMASTERIWDIINTRRLTEFDLPVMYGLATDDGHSYHRIPSRASEPGRGWVMVLASELSPEALIAALEQGRFYASSGVTLKSVATSKEGLDLVVDAKPGEKYRIEFVGTCKGYDSRHRPVTDAKGEPIRATERYSDELGKVLKTVEGNSATYRFDGSELYVRARITSSKPHPNPSEVGEFERAWVQPHPGPAVAKKSP